MGREGLTGEGQDKPSGARCRISARLGRVCALQVGVEVNEPWDLAFPRLLPLPTSTVAPPGAAWAPHRASVAGWDPVLKRPRPSRVGGQDRPLAARGPCAQAGRRRPCPAGPRDGGARVGSRPPAQEQRGVSDDRVGVSLASSGLSSLEAAVNAWRLRVCRPVPCRHVRPGGARRPRTPRASRCVPGAAPPHSAASRAGRPRTWRLWLR